MSTQGLSPIADEVSSWPGVTTGDNGRMSVEFRVGKIELGHMHGRHIAHLPVPRRQRDSLIEGGKATPHPVVPHSGWIQRIVATPEDEKDTIDLLRQNYDRARNRSSNAGARRSRRA